MYDPMVAKLIVWDADREQATQRMLRALDEYEIEGLKTLIPFHKALLATDDWKRGSTCKDLLEDKAWLKTLAFPKDAKPAEAPRRRRRSSRPTRSRSPASASTCAWSDRRSPAAASPRRTARRPGHRRQAPKRAERKSAAGGGPDTLEAPLQGNMWKVLVKEGDVVTEGQLLCIIEAMKMENEITAHKAGKIVGAPDRGGRADPGGRPDRDDRQRRGLGPEQLRVACVDRAHLTRSPPLRQLRARPVLGERAQIRRVLLEHAHRPCRTRGRARGPGTTCSAAATSGRSRSSVATYSATSPPPPSIGISIFET